MMNDSTLKKLAVFLVLITFSLAGAVQAKQKKKGKGKGGEATEDVELAFEEVPAEDAPTEGSETTGEEDTAAIEGSDDAELEIIKKAGAYSVRLRNLEQKVNQLKEKIFRSKARLSLLAEKVLAGPAGAGARAKIIYSDKMGSSFRLVKTVFILDGVPVYNKADEKGMKKKKSIELFNSPVVPGEHTLSVNVEYKGNGYGLFAYLNDYRFKVRSSHAFSVDEGKAKSLKIVIFERGNIATPLEERPAIKYIEEAGTLSD